MTAPIQEPTTDRAIQGFAYARDQIFRRPAPASGFVASRFSARRVSPFQTIATGVETDLLWNQWDNGNPDIFGETLVGGLLRGISLDVDGVYGFYVAISIQSLSTGALAVVMNDNIDNPVANVHPAYNFGSGADYMWSSVQSYPTLQSGGGSPEVSFDVAQSSGISRNTQFGTHLEIVYLGPAGSEFVS